MNDSQIRSTDMVEVTDSLEAIGVFRIWKNVFAAVLIAGLFVVQLSFWCIHQGWYVDPTAVAIIEPNTPPQEVNEAPAVEVAGENPVSDINVPGRVAVKPNRWYSLSRDEFGILLNVTNGVVLFSALMYSLTLSFAMKISILGRFGGINHICRAFYTSLLMLVLLLPWQKIMGGFMLGALYSYQEVDQWVADKGMVWLYLRFTLIWLMALLLVIQAQSRTTRWARSILRRLEIL